MISLSKNSRYGISNLWMLIRCKNIWLVLSSFAFSVPFHNGQNSTSAVFNSRLMVSSSVLPVGVIRAVGQMVSRLPHCPASRNIVAFVPTPVQNAYIEQFGTSAYKIALFHQQRDETS